MLSNGFKDMSTEALNSTLRHSRLDALSIWHNVSLQSVTGSQPDLSPRQFVVLTTIYLIDGIHTVRSLAKKLNVTKAVITRALDTLGRYGFVTRGPDPNDKRSIRIQRTPAGTRFLHDFGDLICRELSGMSQGVALPNTHASPLKTSLQENL